MILLTNNPQVRDYFKNEKDVELQFIEKLGYMDVLVEARNMIHKGYVLLTHPLSGSVKPNETPYKSLALDTEALHDTDSLWLIENAISTYIKFEKNKGLPSWSPSIRADFMAIDFDLIKNALKR